jgi:hypothetical protein
MENEFGDLSVWSDIFKDAHGFRPRFDPEWKSTEEYLADMEALQEVIWEEEASAQEQEEANAAAFPHRCPSPPPAPAGSAWSSP